MPITHPFVSAKADGPDATLVRPSNWNADHTVADIDASVTDARTTTVNRPITGTAQTTGTPAAGIGTGILLRAESADEAPSNFGALDCVASDVTAGSEDTYWEILIRVAGAALSAAYRWGATTGNRAIFTHANSADRTYTLPNVTGTVDVLPAGTSMLFSQATAPTGWTRVVDAGNTDAVIIQRTNSEVPGTGGSWTISGLTFSGSALATHQHETTIDDIGGNESAQAAAVFGSGSTARGGLVKWTTAGVAGTTFTDLTSAVSAGTPAGTISSSGAWRPQFREVIVATKD